MNQSIQMNAVAEILALIRESLSQAETCRYRGQDPEWYIESSFVQTRLFLEAVGLPEAVKGIQRIEASARKDFTKTVMDEELGEPYLVWGGKLLQYLGAIEIVLGVSKAGIITKDVVQILRETQYSITDPACFKCPPADEKQVHARIEAVLRCIFPNLMHKPRITKPIKHFEPDTGLPGIRTLIEYKFIANHGDAKRIAEELLADTRGYISKDWEQFIYVVYETKRVKPESQWLQLLRGSGIGDNTNVIVISGEEPSHLKQAKGRAGQRLPTTAR